MKEITGKFKKISFLWLWLIGSLLVPIGFAITAYNIPNYIEPPKREILGYKHFDSFGDVPILGDAIPLSINELVVRYILPFTLLPTGIFCLIFVKIKNTMNYATALELEDNLDIVLRVFAGKKEIERLDQINSSNLAITTVKSRYGSYVALVLQIGNESRKVLFSSNLPENFDMALPVRNFSDNKIDIYSKGDYRVLLNMDKMIKDNCKANTNQDYVLSISPASPQETPSESK